MKIRNVKGYKEFKRCCKYELCAKHYPGWIGEGKYIISTDVPEDELLKSFPEMMDALSPYILIGSYFTKMNRKMDYNEFKHATHTELSLDSVEDIEHQPHLFTIPDVSEMICLSDSIRIAMQNLTEKQRSRVIRRFYIGMTECEIAEQDGVSRPSVSMSIDVALDRMKKSLV